MQLPAIISTTRAKTQQEDGNVLVIILLAIVLIGALTAAIQGTSPQNAHIDKETVILRVSEMQRYASELERGITYVMQNGISESDIRFAHPDAPSDYGDLGADPDQTDQMFSRDGGGVQYRAPPKGVNDGSPWEFYGNTALPGAGSPNAELIAVLPNVSEAFCTQLNKTIELYSSQPEDSGDCIYAGDSARFDDGTQFSSSPNTTEESTFYSVPALQGCVKCTADGSFHAFHALMVR